MDFVSASVPFAAGIAIGVLLTKAIEHAKKEKVIDKEKLLEDSFGEHIYVGSFSLSQARDWIKARQEVINKGAKALVMKITPETLEKLNVNAEISGNIDNYLAIAIVDTVEGQMKDSLLVKYDELDVQLEDLLAKGDGTLVVGG